MRRSTTAKLLATAAVVALGFAGAGAAVAGTPGIAETVGLGSQSLYVAPVTAEVPQVSTPSTCAATCTRTELPRASAATPAVASQSVASPPLEVPATCAGPVLCTGGFTIPGQLVAAATPAIGSKAIATPKASVPATCTAWPCKGANAGGFTAKLTPAISAPRLTPPVWVSVALTPLEPSAGATSGGGRLAGPISKTVKVPGIGPVSLTLFPQGIDAPVDASLTGSLTLKVMVGAQSYGGTIPVSI